MKITIVVAGYGGQGIKFLATILAKSCIANGKYVTQISSYGPEARGGSSGAYLTISDNYIVNPVIKNPDWLVAFNQFAYDTWKDKAKNIIFEENMDNMIALGKLIKKLGFDISIVIETMSHQIDEKYKDRLAKNIENLKKGYDL